MKNTLVISVLVLGLTVFGSIVYFKDTKDKLAYIKSNEVYNEFELKKELAAKYATVQNKRKSILDSLVLSLKLLSAELKQQEDQKKVLKFQMQQQEYLTKKKEFDEDNRRLMEQYSEQIWKQINQYVMDFGKTGGYRFIYGASGNGSLMYAEEQSDITKEVIEYVNAKYKGEKK